MAQTDRITDSAARPVDTTRRAALAKLGLAAAMLYAAPTVTRLDQARAAIPSGGCRPPACGAPGGGPGGGPPGTPPGR